MNEEEKLDSLSEENPIQNNLTEVENKEETSKQISIEVEGVPVDAQPYMQSQFAWLLPSFIWIAGLGIIVFFDFITFGLVPFLLVLGIAGPRYLKWKQSVYYLSEDALYVTMVGIPKLQKKRIFKMAFKPIEMLQPRFGFLGRTLGYASIVISFDEDNREFKIDYMSDYENFINHIAARTQLPEVGKNIFGSDITKDSQTSQPDEDK